MFRHFILTRFNLKIDHIPGYDKNFQAVQTDDWLHKRFLLFEKYCLPSIMNQSCQKFIWFVFFSTDTPDFYVKKISGYEKRFATFKPIFLENGNDSSIKQAFNEAIIQYLNPEDNFVITSRIDNDDGFHRDYISEVQKHFGRQKNTFISFIYGLQYDSDLKVLARMRYKNNHFVSRIEKLSDNIQTVLTYEHTLINEVGEVVYIDNKKHPMWLEIIHGNNIINSLRNSSKPMFSTRSLSLFSSNEKLSFRNSVRAFLIHLRHKAVLTRAELFKRIGIYDFLIKNLRYH